MTLITRPGIRGPAEDARREALTVMDGTDGMDGTDALALRCITRMQQAG